MRNLIEMIGLIKGINYDGVINSLEVERLERWIADNRVHVREQQEIEMLDLLDEVLEDHVVTHDERIRLIQKSEEILKNITDEYTKIFELNGILVGIICDGIVNENEIIQLKYWIDNQDSFVDTFKSARKVKLILNEILEDGIITEDEQKYLLEQLNDIVNTLSFSSFSRKPEDNVIKHDDLLSCKESSVKPSGGQELSFDGCRGAAFAEKVLEIIKEGEFDYQPLFKLLEMNDDDVLLLKHKSIETANFSVRLYNGLMRAGKTDLFDVLMSTPAEIKKIRHIGENSISELIGFFCSSNFKSNRQSAKGLSIIRNNNKGQEQIEAIYTTFIDNRYDKMQMYKLFGFESEKELLHFEQIVICDYELSTRTYNALKRATMDNLYIILKSKIQKIKLVRNLGKTSYRELIKYLYYKIQKVSDADNCTEKQAKDYDDQSEDVGSNKSDIKIKGSLSVDTLGMKALVVPEYYKNLEIEKSDFSIAVKNKLYDLDIYSYYDLLIKDIGVIYDDLYLWKEVKKEVKRMSKTAHKKPLYIQYNIDLDSHNIIDFYLEYTGLSERSKNVLQKNGICNFRDLLNLSVDQLFNMSNAGKTSISEIFEYVRRQIEDKVNIIGGLNSCALKKEYENLQYYKRKNNVEGYIVVFSSVEPVRDDLRLENSFSMTIKEYYHECENGTIDNQELAVRFLNWCSFDVKEEIKQYFLDYVIKSKGNERELAVLKLRGERKTLKEVGAIFNVTRERIRQIENRAVSKVRRFLLENKIVLKIFADRNQDSVLTRAELSEFFGEYTDLIMYVIRNTKSNDYFFDKASDAIIVGSTNQRERIQEYIYSLDEMISEADYSKAILEGVDLGLNEELLKLLMQKEYEIEGKVYHKQRISRSSIYLFILEKYYSEGIRVYDEHCLLEFRGLVKKEFGDIELPENDRAISARLADLCVLCGRGEYKPKPEQLISGFLIDRIQKYIDEYPMNILSYASVFCQFEKELVAEGINNRYFLQGILREEIGDKYYYKKDYIVKGDKDIVFSDEVRKYVRSFSTPVSMKQIMNHFSVENSVATQFSLQEKEIINLSGSYIHADRLMVSDDELLLLKGVIDKLLVGKEFFHSKEIFYEISFENEMLLKRNGINNHRGFFSVLKYYFGDKYQFQRPYIGRLDVEINKPDEIVNDYISDREIVSVDEIMELYKDLHAVVYSILEKIDSLNDSHLLINKNELASIEYIGVNEEIAKQIEKRIFGEIEKTVEIHNLECVYSLPKINVPWTEWLLYSVLNKYSSLLDVGTSDSQFRFAVPLVAKKGLLDIENYVCIERPAAENETLVADDIDDLDYIASILIEEGEI